MSKILVQSAALATPVAPVAAGQVWSFSAQGRWVDWWIPCGPEGYCNFLAESLDIEPRVAGQPYFYLIGEVQGPTGQPLETFPIGRGCMKQLTATGDLVVFANDNLKMYWNNQGAITLDAVQQAAAPELPPCDDPALDEGILGGWRLLRRTLERTQGALFVFLLLLVPSLILISSSQGQDLVRSLGDGDAWLSGVAIALSLLFLATQGWFWTRMIVTANYGVERKNWRPKALLLWGPRVIGIVPFVGMVIALWRTPETYKTLLGGLIGLALLFFVFVILRKDLADKFTPNLRARYYSVFGGVAAIATLAIVLFDPVGFGWALGPAPVVFLGLGSIIPGVVLIIQSGAAVRVPAVLLMLGWAALIGLWVDNHQVGRRAFGHGVRSADLGERMTLDAAYGLWKKDQGPVGANGYTMVLVATEGGASRAGYWTANVLAALHDRTHGGFARHTFAINSVSGGSVGSVGYVAMLHPSAGAANATALTKRLLAFAGKDALSPTLADMLYPDLIQRFFPVSLLPDRAEGLERAWERAWTSSCVGDIKTCSGLLTGQFLDLGPSGGDTWTPIPIVQGASEESGRRILTSRLKFDPRQLDADDFYEITKSDVAVSSAIHNGARFPWISPAGTLVQGRGAQGHIVDGGYFDTAGVETVRELVEAIKNGPARDQHDKTRFVVVSIAYEEPSKPAKSFHFVNEVIAPLVGLFSSRDAHGAHLRRELKLSADNASSNPDPFTQAPKAITGTWDIAYIPVVMCFGQFHGVDFKPTMDWILSGPTKDFIDDAAKGRSGACQGVPDVEAPSDAMDALVKVLNDADAAAN